MTILRRRSDKVDMLKQIPLFASLSQKHLIEVAKRADEVEVAKGTVIADQGERGNQCFVIFLGKAFLDHPYRNACHHRHDFRYLVDNLPGFDRKLLISLSARLREMDKALDH